MAERSPARADLSRSRLLVGLLLLTVVAGGLAFGLSRLRSDPGPGHLVYAARQGVFVRDLATGTDERLLELPDDVEIAVPSPDGRSVAYALGAGQLWLAEVGGERRFEVAQRFTVPLGWSPDGRLIAGELAGDQDLVAVDPDGGRDVLLSGGYVAGFPPVWIDADRFVIAVDAERSVIVDGSEPSEPIDGHPLAVSPDATEMVLARGETVVVASISDGEVTDERELHDGPAGLAAASPAGFLAVGTPDGVLVFEGGTRSREVVPGQVDWLGWARTGAVLLYAKGGAAYAVELPDGEPVRVTSQEAEAFSVLAFTVIDGR